MDSSNITLHLSNKYLHNSNIYQAILRNKFYKEIDKLDNLLHYHLTRIHKYKKVTIFSWKLHNHKLYSSRQ